MIVGKVIGRIVSTRKHDKLVGNKFLICEIISEHNQTKNKLVAVDTIGAGMGETVLITVGSNANLCLPAQNSPVDAAVVGIVDEENDLKIFD
ncbi:MAG: EutN/CcmL family microcompartment protein [Vallitaleaceae bacterium]|nr:EutN/CcmL family microcompartment protein [Vallitaleaceae bacterium]